MSWPGDLQLSQLRLFLRVADAGSMSAAARDLRLSPAAASAALKRLEARVQVRLVERSTRSLRLTPEGELLREHAQAALGLLDDAHALLGRQRERLEGEIHVAAPSDLGRTLVAPLLDDFIAKHPAVRVALYLSDALVDLPRRGVDVALRYGELADSALVARRLHTTERVLVAAPAYLDARGRPQEPADLARHNALVLQVAGRPQVAWTLRRGSHEVRVAVQGDRRCDDGAMVRQWALGARGIAVKSGLDVLDDLNSGRLERVLPGWHLDRLPLHAVLPARRHQTMRVRRLLELLAERFAALGAQAASEPSQTPAG